MALRDPEMECVCDGDGCKESIFLPMVYRQGYNLTDDEAESEITSNGWSVVDGKHYCEGCAIEREGE